MAEPNRCTESGKPSSTDGSTAGSEDSDLPNPGQAFFCLVEYDDETSGTFYSMDGSFGAAYPPPGEVVGLRFTDVQTLTWDPERSAGDCSLYRNTLSNLASSSFGVCTQQDLASATTTDNDPMPP